MSTAGAGAGAACVWAAAAAAAVTAACVAAARPPAAGMAPLYQARPKGAPKGVLAPALALGPAPKLLLPLQGMLLRWTPCSVGKQRGRNERR